VNNTSQVVGITLTLLLFTLNQEVKLVPYNPTLHRDRPEQLSPRCPARDARPPRRRSWCQRRRRSQSIVASSPHSAALNKSTADKILTFFRPLTLFCTRFVGLSMRVNGRSRPLGTGCPRINISGSDGGMDREERG